MAYELLLARDHADYLLRDAFPGDPFYEAVQGNYTHIERALEIGGIPANVSDDNSGEQLRIEPDSDDVPDNDGAPDSDVD
jgi:hypothetical protein